MSDIETMVKTQAHAESLNSSPLPMAQSSVRPSHSHSLARGSSSNQKYPVSKAKAPASNAKASSSKAQVPSVPLNTGVPTSLPSTSTPSASNSSPPLQVVLISSSMFAPASRQQLSVEIPHRSHQNPILQASTSTPKHIQPSPQAITLPNRSQALTSADSLKLLKHAHKLAQSLPSDVPQWDPKELGATCLWDADHPEYIVVSFAGGGEDYDEDWENLDPMLNRVLQVDIPMDVLV